MEEKGRDEEVTSSEEKAELKTGVQKSYPIYDQNGRKTIPLGPDIPL